jgi:1,4-alpha-glucan branching enzyme
MPASLDHVHAGTPMGAHLVADGATFRAWAPNALAVHVTGDFNGGTHDAGNLLNPVGGGHWAGFVPGVKDRDRYMFHVVGEGSEGPKRDPYARELEAPFPAGCIVRETDFPWHETGFATPPFHEFVIYQLHVGVFHTPRLPKGGTFLDVASRVPYLAELGVTAVQLMPIQEFQTMYSLGYNGTDYFAPEMDFAVADDDLPGYVNGLNALLDARGLAPYDAESLRGEMNQLKALVDICHVHGLAVLLDVVYNHAGGDFGDESLYFFDRQPTGDNRRSLYFTDVGHAGGLVFDFGRPEVREFLIHNARFFLDEYRLDGFRYDQVSVIDHDGAPHGWSFCQDLTSTLRFHRPSAFHKAEYWGVNPWIVKPVAEGGAGFDTSLTDGLRIAVRDVIGAASHPDERPLAMRALADSLWPQGFAEHWQFVQGPENHDIVYQGREMRIARLGHPDDPRSWYGRSRARVATALGLTAPGVPMLFMGQEFLEANQWSDNFSLQPELLLSWQAVDGGDKQVLDHLRFVRELLAVRRQQPALRGQGFRAVWASDEDRVLAFHRWVPGEGRDVIVVAHLGNDDRYGYRIGFPGGGEWREVFNSDVYESWVNPDVTGNGGRVTADAIGMHGFSHSAALTLPANGLLVFAR